MWRLLLMLSVGCGNPQPVAPEESSRFGTYTFNNGLIVVVKDAADGQCRGFYGGSGVKAPMGVVPCPK